ncbi:MAG: hypothetical protein M3S32_00940 [Acidobacteriota bacterium]|nr:hypothetical protein [Acidobacteriota bacterium]
MIAVRHLRWSGILVALNLAAWIVFGVSRPADHAFLAEKEAVRLQGAIDANSADPVTTLAGRPVRNFSVFHGGESFWVKTLVVANAPALILASIVTTLVAPEKPSSSFTVQEASNLRGAIFLAMSALQWFFIGLSVGNRPLTVRRRVGGALLIAGVVAMGFGGGSSAILLLAGFGSGLAGAILIWRVPSPAADPLAPGRVDRGLRP